MSRFIARLSVKCTHVYYSVCSHFAIRMITALVGRQRLSQKNSNKMLTVKYVYLTNLYHDYLHQLGGDCSANSAMTCASKLAYKQMKETLKLCSFTGLNCSNKWW